MRLRLFRAVKFTAVIYIRSNVCFIPERSPDVFRIVWKVDRISRNLLDFSTMYKELKDHHVTFISMNEQFDTSTAIQCMLHSGAFAGCIPAAIPCDISVLFRFAEGTAQP